MLVFDDLKKIINGDILNDDQSLDTYSTDASIFKIRPSVVIQPKDIEDIKSLVNFVTQNRGISLTARSAGTDMSGGAINDSIILDMTKYFNKVISTDSDSATSEPGVFYRDFEKETLKLGLIMPSYPSSREICTVGGIVANNAGGERSLFYGQTKNYIKSLKIVLSDGNEYEIKPLNKDELDKKIAQDDFEGKIYREIWQLIQENQELIRKDKPKTHKNSSGYFIWDVWDDEIFDLTKLITGSQGTLGIITEITFKLVKPKPNATLLVINLQDLDRLDKIVNKVLEFKPESFECFDDETIIYAQKFLPNQIPDFDPQTKLVLLANFTGDSKEETNKKANEALNSLINLNIETKIVDDPVLEKKYWKVRRESFNLLRSHSQNMRTAPFIDDIIVRPEKLPQFLPKLKEILNKYRNYMLYTIAGHIGEGNFHIIPLVDLKKTEIKEKIMELMELVNNLVLEFDGSLTAEHNDGLIRGPYLEKEFGSEMYQLFKEIKNIFDSRNIFNPHKKVDATFEYSLKHIQ